MAKNLVIYFSRKGQNYVNGSIAELKKGNTEVIVDYIKEFDDVDTFQVERKEEYPTDYMETTEVASQEQEQDSRPELKKELTSIEDYEKIYIASPNWWGTLPMPLFTQLEKLDFTNKIVKTVITHEGSGLGTSMNDVKKLCVGANIENALAVHGAEVNNSKSIIESWINE